MTKVPWRDFLLEYNLILDNLQQIYFESNVVNKGNVQGQIKINQWGKTDTWKEVHTETSLHSGKIAMSDLKWRNWAWYFLLDGQKDDLKIVQGIYKHSGGLMEWSWQLPLGSERETPTTFWRKSPQFGSLKIHKRGSTKPKSCLWWKE